MNVKIQKILIVCLAIFNIACIAFIWYQSSLPRDESAAESAWWEQMLKSFLITVCPDDNLHGFIVRKSAHFIEYFGFGLANVVLCILVYLQRSGQHSGNKSNLAFAPFVVSFGICAAVASIDETIQIFSNRGPMIQDVALDVFASSCAILIVGLICAIYSKIK